MIRIEPHWLLRLKILSLSWGAIERWLSLKLLFPDFHLPLTSLRIGQDFIEQGSTRAPEICPAESFVNVDSLIFAKVLSLDFQDFLGQVEVLQARLRCKLGPLRRDGALDGRELGAGELLPVLERLHCDLPDRRVDELVSPKLRFNSALGLLLPLPNLRIYVLFQRPFPLNLV
jgi:hypothetical protein